MRDLQSGNDKVKMSEIAMSQDRLSNVSNPEYSSNCQQLVKG